MSDLLRRESLRRQMDLLVQIRACMKKEPEDVFMAWSDALSPLTDRVLHEMMALEGVPPYPHPLALRWWEEDVPA